MMQPNKFSRRNFFGIGMAGAAGLLAQAAMPRLLRGQTSPASTAIQRPERFEDSYIFDRKPFTWPGGKTLAVWIIPNVEVWNFDSPAGSGISPNTTNRVPDVINYSWREYGMRVGLWRIADILDDAQVRATVTLNSSVCDVYPRAVEEMQRRSWEFMGHGITNSRSLSGLALDEERQVIQTTLRTIERATGKRPRGWLGPGLAETFNTLDLLAEEGVTYVGDWNSDDQPFPMKVKRGKMFAVPYGMDINDMSLYNRQGYTGEQYLLALTDQFNTLYADSRTTARVMGIPLHPFLSGQPWRAPYLKRALAHFRKHDGVWFATGSEIVEAYENVAR